MSRLGSFVSGGFSTIILLTLTVGIAGTLGVGSVASRLVEAWELDERANVVRVMKENRRLGLRTSPSPAILDAWQNDLRSFDQMAQYVLTDAAIRTEEGARTVPVAGIGPRLCSLLELAPLVGRVFQDSDFAPGNGIAILSRSVARSHFGSRQEALGRRLMVNGNPVTIVGVFPIAYGDRLEFGQRIDLWIPIAESSHNSVQVVGRLRKGVSASQAQAELDSWAAREVPDAGRGDEEHRWVILSPSERVDSSTWRMYQMSILGGLLLLFVTASNLAHLVTAQAESQRREIATRWALGAERWSFYRVWVGRACLLTLLSGVGGVAIASGGLRLMRMVLPTRLRFLASTVVDGRVVVFVLILAFVVVLGFGVFPHIFRSPGQFVGDLRADSRFGRQSSLGRVVGYVHLVTMAMAAFILSVAAYLVLGTVLIMGRLDVGFETRNVQALKINLPDWKYEQEQGRRALFSELVHRVSSLPGVTSVAISSHAPPESRISVGTVELRGEGGEGTNPSIIGLAIVGPGYFTTLRQRVIAGRGFVEDDIRGKAPVVVLSEASAGLVARDLRSAVGRRIKIGEVAREVIGVVANLRGAGLTNSLGGLQLYLPLDLYSHSMTLVVRGQDELTPVLREAATGLDPDVVAEVSTMKARFADSIAHVRFLTILFSLLAVLAIALAVIGVYGLLSTFAVRQRREIAVRIAVGAGRAEVQRWIVWKGLSRTIVGVAIGLMVSYPLCRVLGQHLFGLEPDNPMARIVAALLVIGAASLASWWPSARASRTEPSQLLRSL